MKRTLLALVALAALAVGAAADAPAASSVLSPIAPAAASAAPARIAKAQPKKASKKKTAKAASKAVSEARGVIVGILAANAAKGLPERILLSVGEKVIEISVDASTVVKSAKGRIAYLKALKKGESVRVAYEAVGKKERAESIRILS